MKWARPKLLRDARSSEQKAYDEHCFRFYSKDDIKAMFGSKNIWKRHNYRFKFDKEEDYIKFQERYEMFVGGYLYFYDERTRSGAIDTVLYFKWSPFQKSFGEYSVIIYIWPAPLKKKNAKVLLSKSSRMVLAAEGGSKKANGGVQLLSASAKTMEAMDGDGDTGDVIDPPPPPPPPPPPFQ